MKKLVLIVAAFLGLSAGSASATCTGPATMHDFPGATFLMSLGTTPDGNCGSNILITTWGGIQLGAASAYGTSPGAVNVMGVNAFVTNFPTAFPLNATPTLANGNGVVPTQGGAVLGATNGMYSNLLQGNAALSATNGLYANILQGNAVNSLTNPFFMSPATGSTWAFTAASGADVSEGSIADTVCAATGNVTVTGCLRSIAQSALSALPAQTGFGVNIGAIQQIDASSNAALVDPCQSGAKTYTPINIVTAANTKIVTGTPSKKTYICGLFLYPGATDNIAIVEGSGTNCGTSPIGLIGGNTAATGIIATALAGFVLPTTGYAHAASTVNANDFCLITSAVVQLSGVAVTVAR